MGQQEKIDVINSVGAKMTLSKSNYLTSGGEGNIYEKNGEIYKIFNSPRENSFNKKLLKLSKIKNQQIAYPKDIFLNNSGEVVGFSMNKVGGAPLVQSFSSVWQHENGFGVSESIELVNKMRDLLLFIHDKNSLVVDGNEMNWMYDLDTQLPYLIDVDSWQIDEFKATAIMPSIRDWKSNSFSKMSDWFSWAIVSFQVFSGIHPFKGVHPSFKKGDVPARIKASVSVFNKDVKLNNAVRDFSLIPPELREWYRNVFENDLRTIPPVAIAGTAKTIVNVLNNISDALIYELIKEFDLSAKIKFLSEDLFLVFKNKSYFIFELSTGKEFAVNLVDGSKIDKAKSFVIKKFDALFLVSIVGDGLLVKNLSSGVCLDSNISGSRVFVFNGRIFVDSGASDTTLSEVSIEKLANTKFILSISGVWGVYLKSTTFFGNIGITDNFGNYFSFFPDANNGVSIYRLDLAKEYKIINAIGLSSNAMVCFVIHRQTGQMYKKLMYLSNDVFVVLSSDEIDSINGSAAINSKGVIISNSGEDIEVVSPNLKMRKTVDGKKIDGYRVFAIGEKFMYVNGHKLFKISLK